MSGGLIKNNGLIRVNPGIEPDTKNTQQTRLFEYDAFKSGSSNNSDKKFTDTTFEKVNTSVYGNNRLIRNNLNNTVEIPVTSKNNKLVNMSSFPEKRKEPIYNEMPPRPALIAGKKGFNPDRKTNSDLNNNALNDAAENALNISREEVMAEYEQIKLAMINEGEQSRSEAKAWANELREKTKADIKRLYDEAEIEITALKQKTEANAYKEGYERGFSEGNEKGYDDGYNKGLRKCKDTLKELMKMMEEIPSAKDEIFRKYEHELFDSIFTIANKITIDSLKQKDKNVIQKMLRQAAKSFRNSDYIKVSLAKLDIEEMGNAELDCLRGIFRETQHVEFEIVKDAPKGTLILDNGSEITDAGIPTQLMMIENLGKGKFREKRTNDD